MTYLLRTKNKISYNPNMNTFTSIVEIQLRTNNSRWETVREFKLPGNTTRKHAKAFAKLAQSQFEDAILKRMVMQGGLLDDVFDTLNRKIKEKESSG